MPGDPIDNKTVNKCVHKYCFCFTNLCVWLKYTYLSVHTHTHTSDNHWFNSCVLCLDSAENTAASTTSAARHQVYNIFISVFFFGCFGLRHTTERVFRWVWLRTNGNFNTFQRQPHRCVCWMETDGQIEARGKKQKVYVPLWSVDYLARIIACSNLSFDSPMNMICTLDVMLTSFILLRLFRLIFLLRLFVRLYAYPSRAVKDKFRLNRWENQDAVPL